MSKPCTPLLPRCCCCCIYMLLLSIAFTTTTTTSTASSSTTTTISATTGRGFEASTTTTTTSTSTTTTVVVPSLVQPSSSLTQQQQQKHHHQYQQQLSSLSGGFAPSTSSSSSSSSQHRDNRRIISSSLKNKGNSSRRRRRLSNEEKPLTANDCLTSSYRQAWTLPSSGATTGTNQSSSSSASSIRVSKLHGRWRCEYTVTIQLPDIRHVIQVNLTTLHTLAADMRDLPAENNKALQLQEENKTTRDTTKYNKNINHNQQHLDINPNPTSSHLESTANRNNPTHPAFSSSSHTSTDIRSKVSPTDSARNDDDYSRDGISEPIFIEENVKSSSSSSSTSTPSSEEQREALSSSSSTSSSKKLHRPSFNKNNNNSIARNPGQTDRSSVDGSRSSVNNDRVDNEKGRGHGRSSSVLVRNRDNLDIPQPGRPPYKGQGQDDNTQRPSGSRRLPSPSYGEDHRAPVLCTDNKLIIQEAVGGDRQSEDKQQPQVVCLTRGGWGSSPPTDHPDSSLVYHYVSSIQLTLIWDPHSGASPLSLGYRMLPLEDIPCSHWCGEKKSLCLLEKQLCNNHKDCIDGSDEQWDKCAVSTSPEQSQASSTHTHKDGSSHMVIIAVSVSVFVVVLMIVPTALMIHFKCRSNQRQQRDTLLQQQQRTHSLSSEMYQSPSSSVQDSSGSSHDQYDQRASLLQDQHHQHRQQHEYQQEPCLGGTLNQSSTHSPSSSSNRQHSLPTSCLEDEETASYTIHSSSLPEKSLLDTHNGQLQQHHLHHHHHHHQQQLTYYTPTDSIPQQPSSKENNNNNNPNTNRRLEKEIRHQSYPHHIARSRDGEEGFIASQRSLRSSSNSLLIHQQVFRPPPNKTVHDRSSPPPPYSPKPPGAKSLDSILPTKVGDGGGGGGNNARMNIPSLQAGQGCDKRSNSYSSNISSRSSHLDNNNSDRSRNTKRQQQASPPQVLQCHNSHRPISIQQGLGQTCSPASSSLRDAATVASINTGLASMITSAAPPDYHQVASAFPPSIPPVLSQSSIACAAGSCGVAINSCGGPLGTNNSASSFGHPPHPHHHPHVAAMPPIVTANNAFSNNPGFCCGGDHVVMPQHQQQQHQQQQQQDAFLHFGTVGMTMTSVAISLSPPCNSLLSASRGDTYTTVNHQQQQQMSSFPYSLPSSFKTVCGSNSAYTSSTPISSSPSSNLSHRNVISSPPPYNPTNYRPPPSCHPPSDNPSMPISPAHPQSATNTHHHHHQQGLPTPIHHHHHQPPAPLPSCPSNTTTTTSMPPNSNNLFVFTKNSPSVCPSPDNSVNVTAHPTSSSSSSSSSSIAPANQPPTHLNTNITKPKMESPLQDSTAPSKNLNNNYNSDSPAPPSLPATSQQVQMHPATSGNQNTTIYSQHINNDNNNSSNDKQQPGSATARGDHRLPTNTLCNNTSTTTSTFENATSDVCDSNVTTPSQVPPTSSSLLPTTFISCPPPQQHHHHQSHHHHHHPQYHPYHTQQQCSHHHHQHHLSTSFSDQGHVDEAISKMSLSSLPSPSSPFSSSPPSSLDPSPTSPFSPHQPPSPSPPSKGPIDNSISPPITSNFIKVTEEQNNTGNLNVFHHHQHRHHPNHRIDNNIHHCCQAADEERGNDLTMVDTPTTNDKSNRSSDGREDNKSMDTNGNTTITAGFVLSAARVDEERNVTGVTGTCGGTGWDSGSDNVVHHHHHHNATLTTTTTPSLVVAGIESEPPVGTAAAVTVASTSLTSPGHFVNNDEEKLQVGSSDDNCNDVISSSPSQTSSCMFVNRNNARGDIDNNISHNDVSLYCGDMKEKNAIASSSSSVSSSTLASRDDNNVQQVHAAASVDKAKEH